MNDHQDTYSLVKRAKSINCASRKGRFLPQTTMGRIHGQPFRVVFSGKGNRDQGSGVNKYLLSLALLDFPFIVVIY